MYSIEGLKGAHATHVELHCLLVAVAVGHLDVSVRLYAAVGIGALTTAADVIAPHVLQIPWYPGTPGVWYRLHGVVADGSVLRLLHLQLKIVVLMQLEPVTAVPAPPQVLLALLVDSLIVDVTVMSVVTFPPGDEPHRERVQVLVQQGVLLSS